MSAEPLILRGDAARGARPVMFGAELSGDEVLATGPWAERYDQVRLLAQRAGFEQGLAEGQRAGQIQGRDEVRARTDSAVQALEQAGRRLAGVDAVTVGDIGGHVLDLALELAAMILQREVAASADAGFDALARVLPLAPEQGELVVRMHADDIRDLGPFSALAPGRDVTLVPDPSLHRGDAVVDAGPCRIDGRLDDLMSRVAGALRGQEA